MFALSYKQDTQCSEDGHMMDDFMRILFIDIIAAREDFAEN